MKKLFLLTLGFVLSLSILAQSNAAQFNTLVRQASAEYDKKNFKLALENYEKALDLIPQAIAYYNAACSASLIGELPKAALYLNKSIEEGYLDKEWLLNDSDFDALKKTSDWPKIVQNIDDKINLLEAKFLGVKQVPLSDLVPFYRNEKWGYLNKNNLKIVIEPMFFIASFGGDCLSVKLNQTYSLRIEGNGKFKLYQPNPLDFLPPPPPSFPLQIKADNTKGFKGFKVDTYGQISHASSYYDASIAMGSMEMGGLQYPSHPIVHSPVQIDSVWWAVARKNDKYGLIDEQGNIYKKIPFNYQQLYLIKETKKGDIWYFFKDLRGQCGLINPKGEIKFSQEFDFTNPYAFENTGFLEVMKGEQRGILDLYHMQWAMKPSSHQVRDIHFSYENKCLNPYNLLRDRDKIKDIYFLCQNGNDKYYVDKKGVKYIPVE